MTTPSSAVRGLRVALYLVLTGVVAALHIWKLPPALPMLQSELGLDLVQSGFLVSTVQVGGMMLGLLAGLLAERIGLKRCILIGLAIMASGSAAGAQLATVGPIMALRAIEGCGFLMVVMPIPSLIRRQVPINVLSRVMGLWSCYIPIGSILILVFGSWMLSVASWRALWMLLAVLTVAALVLVWRTVPTDRRRAMPSSTAASTSSSTPRLDTGSAHPATGAPVVRPSAISLIRETLGALPVWLVAFTFSMYSAQWMAVIGFLPTIYASGGITGTTAGLLTGLVAGCNIIGNLIAGQLLHKEVPARQLLIVGFSAMIVCAYLAFGTGLPFAGQFLSVALLSASGGLIPATMFNMALMVAPSPRTTTTTVGWMQQGSSFGQFSGPPIVAWVVSMAGGWEYAWMATTAFSVGGIVLALVLERSTAEQTKNG
jgi:Cyanate permease